jgi:hypothetical protein
MDTFLSTYPLFRQGVATAGARGDLPTDLKALLEQVGTSTYADGFFTFVAPPAFDHYLKLVNLDPAEGHVFLKCGFGHLVFYHRQNYKVLNPVFNQVDDLGGVAELDFVMDIVLCDRAALESSFMLDLYEQAFPRLGPPDLDEMYALVPALKLGGPRNAQNVRRSKMGVEMQLLLQL